MRTLALLIASLALLSLLPAAHAQQSGSLVIVLSTPEEPVRSGGMVTFHGTVVMTADYTAALYPSGIPVTYYVEEAPAWASVVISPSNDVFPPPHTPQGGASYTSVRTISITVSASDAPAEDVVDALVIGAVTSPGMLGQPLHGQGAVPIAFDAADEQCDEAHAEELLALASEAAESYSKDNAGEDVTSEAPTTSGDEELIVQNTAATPLSLPWIAVAGFALVGGGVGLVMRRRLGP